MSIIAEHGPTLLVLACLFGFFMAWGVGANDVANAMGTSVGAKALTVKQAIAIAIVFEFAGAYLAGGEVSATIRKGILDPELFTLHPELLVFGMMSALLAAGSWLLIASMMGWPVSTTHSIVGALIGFAVVGVSVDAVNWSQVSTIVASWIVSPFLAGIISFGLFTSVQKLILHTSNPLANARRYIPLYIFSVGFMIAMVSLLKGFKHLDFTLSLGMGSPLANALLLAFIIGLVTTLAGSYLLHRVIQLAPSQSGNRYVVVERMFAILMVFTACAMAFAHGSNDVANAVGPLAAIISVINSGGEISKNTALPSWVLLLGGAGIVLGLATYGFRVMATIGKKITELTPSRGFAAELGASTTVVIASATGLPVSTTHTLVGAVLGVGLARGIGALNMRVITTILMSWVITLPVGAGLAIVFFFIFKWLFT